MSCQHASTKTVAVSWFLRTLIKMNKNQSCLDIQHFLKYIQSYLQYRDSSLQPAESKPIRFTLFIYWNYSYSYYFSLIIYLFTRFTSFTFIVTPRLSAMCVKNTNKLITHPCWKSFTCSRLDHFFTLVSTKFIRSDI